MAKLAPNNMLECIRFRGMIAATDEEQQSCHETSTLSMGVGAEPMRWILLAFLLSAVSALGGDLVDEVHLIDRPVYCSAFKPEYRFSQGYAGALGYPLEAFLRLVAIQGDAVHMLNTRTSLVGFVSITNGQQALEFVRLFSLEETHYLFDDAEFIELPKNASDSSFWYDEDSTKRARKSGVPIDSPPVEIISGNDGFIVKRYVMDDNRNIVFVVEAVQSNGSYSVTSRSAVAKDIWVRMPTYE